MGGTAPVIFLVLEKKSEKSSEELVLHQSGCSLPVCPSSLFPGTFLPCYNTISQEEC